MQTALFTRPRLKPRFKKEKVSSLCTQDCWFTNKATGENYKLLFRKGVTYPHLRTTDLALQGEEGVSVWMDTEKYSQHFTRI